MLGKNIQCCCRFVTCHAAWMCIYESGSVYSTVTVLPESVLSPRCGRKVSVSLCAENKGQKKVFLPNKLLECLPRSSSLPNERLRWNTNEVGTKT